MHPLRVCAGMERESCCRHDLSGVTRLYAFNALSRVNELIAKRSVLAQQHSSRSDCRSTTISEMPRCALLLFGAQPSVLCTRE